MIRLLYNHLGYRPGSLPRLLLEAPQDCQWRALELVRWPRESLVWQGMPHFLGRVDGWSPGPWWGIDGVEVPTPGDYVVRWDSDHGSGRSDPFRVGPEVLGRGVLSDLLFYFKGQRCSGIWDAADRAAPRVGDGLRRDVHGGWYDASGDTSKYLSHLSYANFMNPQQTPLVVWVLARAWQLLRTVEAPPFFLERVRDEALHGADFLVRMQDAEGFWYQTVFDRWSKDPEQRELCAYRTQEGHKEDRYAAGWRQGGGLAVAALAQASRLGDGGAFDSAEYRSTAEKGFLHLQQEGLKYLNDGEENLVDDLSALLAATELGALETDCAAAAATERRARLGSLRSRWGDLGGWPWLRADAEGRWSWFHASDAGLAGVVLERLAATDPALSPEARELADALLRSQLALGAETGNPFGYPPHWVVMPDRPPARQWFYPHENPSGYWWQGENARVASLAASALGIAGRTEGALAREAHEAAEHWIAWILGRNPFDRCMLHGRGRGNPAYAEGYDNAPGGVCNGITSGMEDEQDIAFAPPPWDADPAQNWRWGEQWIPHAAWLFYALALRFTGGSA